MSARVSVRKANGLDRPLYFDRQLLVADDLSLEQGFEDRRLALLARNVLGWGVAAGFGLSTRPLSPAAAAVDLAIGPGFALTPLGDEVYLSQEVVIDDIAATIAATCGTPADCTIVDGGEGARAAQPGRAWIIARPAPLHGGPRPAWPEGCGHPGNHTHPSRSCGGATVEIACSLLSPHGQAPLDPGQLQAAVCGPWGPPLAGPVNRAANYVVLGAVEIVAEGVFATPRDRRLIPRLDSLGRLVCTLDHSGIRYVTHIQRDREDEDRSIDKLAGFDGSGTVFVESLDQAIAAIEAGRTYRTLPVGFEGRKVLVRKRKSRKYLQTEGDDLPPNNLLSLPEIRDT
ncbi:MAG TPA: DUF3892 domain-containing protein [Allosphingosinicella sp.]